MAVLAARARSFLRRLRSTPLHPQWLVPADLQSAPDFFSRANGDVLDIGCADRWASRHLPPGTRYIGLDYPATGVALYGARPDILADAAQLPLSDASIDTVLLLDVFEHLRCPREALQECQRVLRSGGRLLVSVPFLYPVHDAPHDYQRLTVHGLRRDIEQAGLQLEWVRHSSGSLESSGLLMCIALAGSVHEAWLRRSAWLVAAPLLLALVPIVNVGAWLGGRWLPNWPALTSGYRLVAIKP
ncbi:class I SAM-dependent methyltransferase [Lysobacter sp. S4-A87]|uniref:class I SAM-dependent methyltransferase n=1 Tax=Lysobacter sp. S4-A87 TaxID=2925843 RepID=UPI001F536CB1|nr:class I SAM-dependent methyltransferase [Lysobacter sp. S4-A87]UNK48976.1 class I SAM-dependent methyltransferase [Lysobacter sp. S4-A87]